MCIRDRVSTQSTWGEVKFFAFGRSFTSVAFMNTEKITLTFVTGNAKKLKELRSIVGEDKFNLLNEDIDLPELQGEPELIAKEKCKIAFEKVSSTPCQSIGPHLHSTRRLKNPQSPKIPPFATAPSRDFLDHTLNGSLRSLDRKVFTRWSNPLTITLLML
eukprot:TRINITY_DN517_c0_g1_i7.p2 TRINITY_DN517_c0_g1~~TRINITY_DN517_c0_g1_i7.p2  ORF type:complete len:160 (+),score=23.45 TRINITY_DN517_c0_g1_i7:66-545(+)